VGKVQGKRLPARRGSRWEGNVKVNLKDIKIMWTDFVWLVIGNLAVPFDRSNDLKLSFPNVWGISLLSEKVKRCASVEVERLDRF